MKALRLTQNAVNYMWRQFAQRVGITFPHDAVTGFEELGIPVFYGEPEQANFSTPGLIISRCTDKALNELLYAIEKSISWIPVSEAVPATAKPRFNNPIPILFWGGEDSDANKPFGKQNADGTVVLNVDILAASFLMLSRWEEMVLKVCDEHGRFPATASVAYRQGFLDLPLVDQYAMILREWIRKLLPDWDPKPRRFSIKLSHDVDHLRYFRNWKIALRSIQAAIQRSTHQKQIWKILLDAMFSSRDPYLKGIFTLAACSRHYGFTDVAFYFMVDQSGKFGSSYDPSTKIARKCIQYLHDNGFETGFHPGYYTCANLEMLVKEKQQMDAVLGKTRYGGRQHYLRFHIPLTWRNWEKAGLDYDSSLGYAEYEGFRCGTCHPYAPFDIEQDRVLNLEEIPLIVMDATLKDYRQLTPDLVLKHVLSLAQSCKDVEGVFTLLWHNTSLFGQEESWTCVYEKLLMALATLQSEKS